MSLWFLLWFLLSFILLGATFWSTLILIHQKTAWRNFAKRHNLTFSSNKFFEPSSVEGVLDGYNISFFTAVQQNPDSRKNRQLTVMQITSNVAFVNGFACGTSEMLPFLQSLEAITPHDMTGKKWNKDYHIRSRNKAGVDIYLTEERVSILSSILSMPKADILLLLSEEEGVFRFETTNPLTDDKQIDVVVQKLLARIKKLEPTKEELEIYRNAKPDTANVSEEVMAEVEVETEEKSKEE